MAQDKVDAAAVQDQLAAHKMAQLRERIEAARDAAASAEEKAAASRAFLSSLITNDAVEVMRDLDLDYFEFEDGATLTREQKMHVSMTQANEEEAFAWLKKNGHGALLKTVASVEFGKGEAHHAEVLQAFVDRLVPHHEIEVLYGNTPPQVVAAIETFVAETFPEHKLTVETKVHASTLRAFISKMMKLGKPLPACFGVYAPQVVTLALPKGEPEGAF